MGKIVVAKAAEVRATYADRFLELAEKTRKDPSAVKTTIQVGKER